MDTAFTLLKQWLWINAVMVPVYGFILWVLSNMFSQVPAMLYTRPKEIGSHPMLEVKGIVRYLGGSKYPLPHRFGIFHAWPLVVVYPAISLYSSLERLGFSWAVRTGIMLSVLLMYLVPIMVLFRKYQPRWLKLHLASLPADAIPPESKAAVDALPS